MKEIRIECMSEILEGLGIEATKDQIKTIVEDFSLHFEMESEMSSYQNSGYSEPCKKCSEFTSKISLLEKENEVFTNSVKQRRNASKVWIERGEVMFEK